MYREVTAWVRRTDWLWLLTGGFYLLTYLFWYREALAGLPGSLGEAPDPLPPGWPLDFALTGFTGVVLVYLGLRRAAGGRERRTRWTYQSSEDAMR